MQASPCRARLAAVSELDEFRAAKDAFLRDHPQSPLTSEQRPAFGGLAYFDEAPALVVRGVLEEPEDPAEFAIPTSTGQEQAYRRAGVLRCELAGQPAGLTLLARVGGHAHDLFLPFRDATSGRESYPAGRYLDVPAPGEDRQVTVDFNYAYNPYCAYNDQYSCPLPPPENWLQVPVRAGERAFPRQAP